MKLSCKAVRPHLWFTLYSLMRLGAVKVPIKVSTTELSRVIGGSQQSASRHLQLLEEGGLITRRIDSEGGIVEITEKGVEELKGILVDLKAFIEGEEAEAFIFEGEVVSGLYEGAYYIGKGGYRDQIREKLGFDPYPGTLNVKIGQEDYERRRRLEGRPAVLIEGFRNGERAFGACRCYPLLVNDEVEGALIVADRTTHDAGVMEIVSPVYLRRHFGLSDGDRVRLAFSNRSVSYA
jgi:riboflavin kinase